MNIFPSVASSSDRMEESSETGAISTEIESQNGENDCECFTLSRRRTRRENQQKGEWMRKRRRQNTARRAGDRRGRGTKVDIRGTEKDGQSARGREREREECIPGRVNPWSLEWLTMPWIHAFYLPLCSSWSCAFSYVRAIERWYGGIKRSGVLSSAIDLPILNIAKLTRKWIVIEVKVGNLTCGCAYFLTRSPWHLRPSPMRWPNRYHKQLTKSLSDCQLFTLYFRRLHELPFALFVPLFPRFSCFLCRLSRT